MEPGAIEKVNPKALNLERLKNMQSKITLGFKCSPKLKLELAQRAQSLGISLSECVESIVLANNEVNVHEVQKMIDKIRFYENDILKEFFSSYKEQTIEFVNAKGQRMKITINSLQDVYTIIINSFKTV